MILLNKILKPPLYLPVCRRPMPLGRMSNHSPAAFRAPWNKLRWDFHVLLGRCHFRNQRK